MKYLLDTNTCIFLMKNLTTVVERYKTCKHFGIAISSITVAELYFGVYNSSNPSKNGASLTNFLIGLEVLEFDSAAAMEYGRVRAALRKQGTPIGPLDMLIAAHAKAKGLTIVTNNVRELRIEFLEIEDWSKE
uniref:Ribonuclease VapC n=1 Tax=uncultured bacterium contig00009 TaxID=1181501 RepID=A0A806JZU0_9BACT|nr:VapC toxin protein [uncultured bacterium contig00009]